MEQIKCTTARPRGYGFLIAIWILALTAVALVIYTLFPPSEHGMAEAIEVTDTYRPAETYRYLRYQAKMEAFGSYLDDLEEGDYQMLFLGMYSLENYPEEDFEIYMGINARKLDPVPDNTMELMGALELLLSGDFMPQRIYLGLDPAKLAQHLAWEEEPKWRETFAALTRKYEEVQWEILLSYPSLKEWQELPEEERAQTLTGYEQAMEALVQLDNVQLSYFGGKEWLICNQDNYSGKGALNAGVSHLLLLQVINQTYQVTEENQSTALEELEETLERWQGDPLYVKERPEYTLVFLGDSIIGNYTGSLSVPGVVQNFTDARAVNCGYGGLSMSRGEEEMDGVKLVSSLISGQVDAIPNDVSAYEGILKLRENAPDNERLVFFLNFGINDYIAGYAVEAADAYDVTTYKGAMRTAIEQLQQAYPGAQIVIMTPTFINRFEQGTQRMSDVGGIMTDYVEAAVTVAEEYSLPCMNNYRDLDINVEKEQEMLVADHVHLNENGRYRLGLLICQKLNEILQ